MLQITLRTSYLEAMKRFLEVRNPVGMNLCFCPMSHPIPLKETMKALRIVLVFIKVILIIQSKEVRFKLPFC